MIERFRALPQTRQLGIAGVAMVILAACMFAIWFSTHEPYRPLFTQLRGVDAATIVDELEHKHTPYRLADGGSTILVPESQVDGARLGLMNGNLALKGTVGFELFNKSDMGLTDFSQRINYQRALQGELERTIMSLDGVEESRVHLSLGEDRIFREDRVPPKASVTIRMRIGASLAGNAAVGVQRLVAAAVPQLEAKDVVILDEAGEVISPEVTPQGAAEPPQSVERGAIGAYYAARVRDALLRVFTSDQVKVSVHAGLSQRNADTGREWTPASRDFPLQVVLEPGSSIDASGRQDMQGIAAGAISFDGSKGDSVTFGAIAPPTLPGVLAVRPPVSRTDPAKLGNPSRPTTGQVDRGILLGLGVAGVALIGLAFWLLGRSTMVRRLDTAERARMSARLAALLEKEEQDGVAIS